MHRILFLLLLLLFTGGCTNTTIEKEKYDDGKIKSEKVYSEVDGEKVLVKELHYHPNGEKYMEGAYKDNKRHGHWVSWYDNGQLWSEGDFNNGLSEGKWIVYHRTGKKHYEGNFKDGERTGVWKFYDDAGNQINEVDYSKTPNP